ncbi:MAG: CpaE family protein [Candidatus Heimdallarchaeota archaeon]
MKVIAFHSYKGGTGKTHLSSNLAAMLAGKYEKRVCLLDLDFRGPNLATLFGVSSRSLEGKTLNDLLIHGSRDNLLTDLSSQVDGPLSVAFASEDFRKMGEVIRADKRQRHFALKQILKLKDELAEKGFDYAILDTSPGVQMESIDGLVISDIVFLVLKGDDFDLAGTRSMVQQLYSLLDSQNYLLVNRVVDDETCNVTLEIPSGEANIPEKAEKEIRIPVIKAISCYCDLPRFGSTGLFVKKYPDHPFSQEIDDLANKIVNYNENH